MFTPFVDDKKLTVNYEVIDKYAHHLKTMGFHGVMVLGSTGKKQYSIILPMQNTLHEMKVVYCFNAQLI